MILNIKTPLFIKRFFSRYKVKHDVYLGRNIVYDTWFQYEIEYHHYFGWRDFEWTRKVAQLKCDELNIRKDFQ